jgi:hypothetical protein
VTTTLQDKFALLQQQAESVGRDIKGDHPEMDTSYDLYVEDMWRRTYGVINMGEAYQRVFVWNVHHQEWDEDNGWDPFYVETEILKKRGAFA